MRVDSKFDNMMSSKTEEEIVHLMLLTSFMIEEYTTWTINNRDKSRNTWWRAEEYARHDKHSTRGWKTSNWRNQLQFNADGQDTYSLLLRTIKNKNKKKARTYSWQKDKLEQHASALLRCNYHTECKRALHFGNENSLVI